MERFDLNIEKKMTDDDQRVSTNQDESKNKNGPNAFHGKQRLAVFLAAFASLGGWFFGYDQGVTGGIVIMRSFRNDFCIGVYGDSETCNLAISAVPSEYRRFITLFTLLYNVGCFIGAVFISSFVAEKYGRRAILFTASILFLIGTSMVIFPPGGSKKIMILILIGRIVEGTGVGCSSFSCPLYASEIAPTHLRGMLSGFMQMTVVIGLFAANVVNIILEDHKYGWRISNGIILIAPLALSIGIFFCPETPRWLYRAKGREAAERSLKRIRKVDDVSVELKVIADAVEQDGHQLSYRNALKNKTLLKRIGIGMGIHILQQATGINPIFTFGGIIYESVIGNGLVSLLVLSGTNLLSTIPALFLFDRLGRRKLLIWCGLAMFIGHLIAATVFITGCRIDKIQINGTTLTEDKVNCETASGIVMLIATAIFVAFFAISWGPIAWIYAAEIFPLNFRSHAVSITTGSNWFMGTIMSYILELINPIGIAGVFYLFSGLTLTAVAFVVCFCPETKGISLENIDDQFKNFSFKNGTFMNLIKRTRRSNVVGESNTIENNTQQSKTSF